MVLIVDDQPDIGELLNRALLPEGIPAVCVSSGEEALKLIPTLRPNVIIMDEVMPTMTGTETLRELRKLPNGSEISVFMHSVVPQSSNVWWQLGVRGWFRKGITPMSQIITEIKSAGGAIPGK